MDSLLLHALSDKAQYGSLRSIVPDSLIGQDTVGLLAWFSVYWLTFPERERIDPDELKTIVGLRSAGASPEQLALTYHLIDGLKTPPDEHALKGMLGQLYTLDLSGRTGAMLERYNSGQEIDLVYELKALVDEGSKRMSSTVATDFVRDDIGKLLQQLGQDNGLKFNFIAALRDGMRGLIPGDSGMFAARVDAGKTSFLCKMATHFAPQVRHLKDIDGNAIFEQGRPIVFLVNESEGNRMLPRLRQSALGIDMPTMIAMHNAGELEPAYHKALGGTPIEVKNIHGWNVAQLERFVQEVMPCMFVLDMPANLRMSITGNKTDALEETWQRIRDLAVMTRSIGMGTAQISAEGKDMLYPPMDALKDSKTGVQGALDFQINMGNLSNPAAQKLRGISTPKNKLSRPGQPSNVQTEVVFEKDTCQFQDGAGATTATANPNVPQ
jgi:replicative DNA helicase